MALNGINNSVASNYEARARFNFSRFNTNVSLDNMDRMNNAQNTISKRLSDVMKERSKNDEDGINFSLYVKEDENNSEQKSKTKESGNESHIILNPGEPLTKAPGRTSSPAECETCANRKYQDGSDETDVSFQTPTHIPNSIAASVILAHEHEHVANAYEKENSTSAAHNHTHAHVDSAQVQLKTDICPECGRVYFSGGVTNTVISYIDDEQYEKENYRPKIFVPNQFKDEDLQELLTETKADVEYFDDENYDDENPYIIVPNSLKERLGREQYIEFLEEVTNLKIKPYDSPADEVEEKIKNKYKPYTKFKEEIENGNNVDMQR